MEKETNDKKRKMGIIIFVVVIVISLGIALVLVVNNLNHECEINSQVNKVNSNNSNITSNNFNNSSGAFGIDLSNERDDKPIIYLYPETEQEVSVKVGYEDRLTCTYPKYNDGWNVLAKPNGDLVDLSTGRKLYALYWEGIDTNAKVEKDGFVVKGEDSIEFLEEKLDILGLNEREAEEFIIYWLPKLEANKYNYIRFETADETDANMPLIVNPMPDTVIRIVMNFKGLDKPIEVEEQELNTPERKGFTVVEWGGTEIK